MITSQKIRGVEGVALDDPDAEDPDTIAGEIWFCVRAADHDGPHVIVLRDA